MSFYIVILLSSKKSSPFPGHIENFNTQKKTYQLTLLVIMALMKEGIFLVEYCMAQEYPTTAIPFSRIGIVNRYTTRDYIAGTLGGWNSISHDESTDVFLSSSPTLPLAIALVSILGPEP